MVDGSMGTGIGRRPGAGGAVRVARALLAGLVGAAVPRAGGAAPLDAPPEAAGPVAVAEADDDAGGMDGVEGGAASPHRQALHEFERRALRRVEVQLTTYSGGVPVAASRTWAVLDGTDRSVGATEFATTVRDASKARAIRRLRSRNGAGTAVGAGIAAGLLVPGIAVMVANDPLDDLDDPAGGEIDRWAAGLMLTMSGSLVAGTVPLIAAMVHASNERVGKHYTRGEADDLILEYNLGLARDLGLPEDELRRSPPKPPRRARPELAPVLGPGFGGVIGRF